MKQNSYLPTRYIFSIAFLLLACLFPHQMVRAENAAPTQGGTITYMPFVTTPPKVVDYAFATSNSCSGEYEGEVQAAPLTLSHGFKRLGYVTYVLGGVGLNWREEWIVDGQVLDGLTETGTITESFQPITRSIVYGDNGNCGDNIKRGEWIVRFYLDGRLAQEAVVTIR